MNGLVVYSPVPLTHTARTRRFGWKHHYILSLNDYKESLPLLLNSEGKENSGDDDFLNI